MDATSPPPTPPPEPAPPPQPMPQAQPATGDRRKKLIVIVIAIVIVLAAVSIALVVLLQQPAAGPTLGSVAVFPNQASMNIGEDKQFLARALSTADTVMPAGQVTVTWTVAPAGVGTLSNASGMTTTFHAVAQGTATITATATAGVVTKSAQATATVLPPPYWADHYTVAGPASVVQTDPFTLTLTVIDNVGSVLSAYRGTVHFISTDPSATLPADYTYTAADSGVHPFTDAVRLFTTGNQVITATDAANATLTGTRSVLVVANQLPNARFTYTKNLFTINTDASASNDPDGTVVSYAWEWGDSATGTGVTATHTYAAPGVYQVNLTVTDNRGGASVPDQQLASFLVPVANFTSSRTGYRLDVDASGSVDSDGTIVSYAWTWGDTTTGAGQVTSHTYAGDGDYAVNLTVTDNDGLTGTMSRTFHFHRPTASFLLTADNLTVNVDASGSTDSDGTIVSYAWEWGDSTTGAGVTASHTYATKGTYAVNLTVTDNDGLTGLASRTATVSARPIAAFNVTVVGLRADVNASASYDPDGTIVSYAWEWGDSTTGANVTASHTYATAGTYTVNLTVTDNDGLTDSLRRAVTVGLGPQAPHVYFSLTIDGLHFLLLADASASFDPDGTIVSYTWNWGDTNTGSGVTATHTYAAPGLYTVGLTVRDNDGLTNSTTAPVSWFPPTARFTVTRSQLTVNADGTSSSDPDGTIVSYTWDWGDTATGVGPTPSHTYGAPGAYTITLNVTDADGFWNRVSLGVAMRPPTAQFSFTRDLYTVNVDASASFDPDGTIVSYAWDWGDTATGAGVTASHTYGFRGAYSITLTVTDNDTLTGTASKIVTVNATTLDYTYYDFFRVPYGEWWDKRTGTYGDLPIGADCFNATSIADGECAGTTYSTYPYTDWFPTPGSNTNPGNPNTSPLVYSTYRFNVTGKNAPAYDINTPVLLPLSAPSVPGGSVQLDWRFQYLDKARTTALETRTPWNTIPGDNCGTIWTAQDGFIGETTMTYTMDYNTSRKVFGVSGDPAAWWSTRVNPGCLNQGTVELAYETWLILQGGGTRPGTYPGAYDIFPAYQWYYGPFFTDFTWQVLPGPGGGNTTVVTIHHATWGFEALMARWFYWGRTTYLDHFNLGAAPRGWWGMELPWFEDFHMNGTISTAFDFHLTSAMVYHFINQGRPGLDGLLGTNDDYSSWAWQPTLADYIFSVPKHPYSELDAYNGLTYLHDSPGSAKYGIQFQYDVRPIVWNLRAGETLTFRFPVTPVTFYDPVRSPRVSDPATLVGVQSVPIYDSARPAGLGQWDAVSGTWSVSGPTTIPSPAVPLYTDMAFGIWLR